jgi:lipopolysaccharide transport system permease protein
MLSSNTKSVNCNVIEIRPNKGLFSFDLGTVWRYRELLYLLIWRELKVRYKQAAIGTGWAVIQPLFAVFIFTIIFGNFAKLPSDGIPYPLFALAALLPWTYFSEALRRSSTGLVDDSELLRKIYFPRLVIPMAMVTAPLIDLFITLLMFAVLFIWYGFLPTWKLVYLPVFVIMAMGLAFSLSLWLGPINVRFRDIKHTLPFLIQVWMYASPIIYPLSIVPDRWRAYYNLNPLVGIIEGFRWSLLNAPAPDIKAIGISAGFIALLLLSGLIYFKKTERFFADVI